MVREVRDEHVAGRVGDDVDEEGVRHLVDQAAVGEVRGLGGKADSRGAVATPRRAVTERAVRGVERAARLDVNGCRRHGPGGRHQPAEDGAEENDAETEETPARSPGRTGVHATP